MISSGFLRTNTTTGVRFNANDQQILQDLHPF